MSNNNEEVQSSVPDVETTFLSLSNAQTFPPSNDEPDSAKPQSSSSSEILVPNTAKIQIQPASGAATLPQNPTTLSTTRTLNEIKVVEESNVQTISLGGELNVVRQLNAAPISLSELKVQKPSVGVTFSDIKVHQINTPVALGMQQISNPVSLGEIKLQQLKSHSKIVVPAQTTPGTSQILQKVVNPPLITVLNSTGPLTVVKNLCVSTGLNNNPSHYSVVNSAPLSATNTLGKPSTITVLNCGQLSPVNVAKSFESHASETKVGDVHTTTVSTNVPVSISVGPTVVENRGHNVFVKHSAADSSMMEGKSQGHKLLTATNFPQTNMLSNVPNKPVPLNGQRNRIKMNNAVPTIQQSAVITKMTLPGQQKYFNRQKLTGIPSQPKHMGKVSVNNVLSTLGQVGQPGKLLQEKPSSSYIHSSVPKSHLKTLPGGYMPKYPQGIKTLPPHQKMMPGQQIPRTGVRTIPPQKVQKVANKPNYIGKHAIQGQKVRQPYGSKGKGLKSPSGGNYLGPAVPDKQLTFNQALTAQIIETLSNPSTPPVTSKYEMLSSRYDNAFNCPDKQYIAPQVREAEEKSNLELDTLPPLSKILLDHNYSRSQLSPEEPTPPITPQAQVNGVSSTSLNYPPPHRRRTVSHSVPISAPSPIQMVNQLVPLPPKTVEIGKYNEDGNTSDLSDVSDHKHDTEGEETDTAPEAEDVKNEDPMDHYGDYVTRCICGFIHDDGYMVECDNCKVWQHVQCVLKNKQVPDEYLCEVCDPTKPIDRQKARLLQQQYIRDRQLLDAKIKRDLAKMKQQQSAYKFKSDTDSSDAENEARINMPKTKPLVNRRKSESSTKIKKEPKEAVVQRRQKRKERKIVKKKTKTPIKHHPQSEEDNHDSWSSHLPQLRQWIEKYEEAVTNHYSPELRARISSIRVNGTHLDQTFQYDSHVVNCRVHTQPLTEIKYLVSTAEVAADVPIIELRGKYMLSNQHRNLCGSLNTRLHTQKPGPFLFFYRLPKDNTEVCVDTRTYGNAARFIRRSCKPNTELRHCIEKGVLHLYIVSISNIAKDCELTLKHESHDLASIGTMQIACACGQPDECNVNKTTIKKNGELPERKRRVKRNAASTAAPITPKPVVKEEPPPLSPPPPPPSAVIVPEVSPLSSPKEEKIDIEEDNLAFEPEIKIEVKEEEIVPKNDEKDEEKSVEEKPLVIKQEIKDEKVEEKIEKRVEKKNEKHISPKVEKKESIKEEERSPSPVPVVRRRVSHKSDREDDSKDYSETRELKNKSKKLSREERKLEAILRAIEQMEKADQRKQEHQAKQAHRRESEPGVNAKDDEKGEPKTKRRRRRGRARTTSTTQSSRRSRLNSTDSYMTSGDEILLSPNDSIHPAKPIKSDTESKDLVLNLPSGDARDRTPPRDMDTTNSNSANSSPETPQLSSACLLVQAAVEPLESGFKFPKTKKVLMNEWLQKTPEPASLSSSPVSSKAQTSFTLDDSDSRLLSPEKPTNSLIDNLPTRGGNAKKRWLRQAISEDHSTEASANRSDSPPSAEMVAPPKKRKLPRETLTSKDPNLTPLLMTSTGVTNMTINNDTPPALSEPAPIIQNRMSTLSPPPPSKEDPCPLLITKPAMFGTTGDQLVGAVEKTLSILGLESTPAQNTVAHEKRKVRLSISEYRQRKKINSDKSDEIEDNSSENPDLSTNTEEGSGGEVTQKESSRANRQRSISTSSTSSLTSDDDSLIDIKALKAPGFNSEPTELERQREISNMRLKRAFGLTNEPKRPSDLKSSPLLSSLPSFAECSRINSPNSPIAKCLDLDKNALLLSQRMATPPVSSVPSASPLTVEIKSTTTVQIEAENLESQSVKLGNSPVAFEAVEIEKMDESEGPSDMLKAEAECPVKSSSSNDTKADSALLDSVHTSDKTDPVKPHLFYTPDDDDPDTTATSSGNIAESSSGNYVPPFNNPVYPNNQFNTFTSSIDDDSRYQSRNPSPPPEMDSSGSSLNLPC